MFLCSDCQTTQQLYDRRIQNEVTPVAEEAERKAKLQEQKTSTLKEKLQEEECELAKILAKKEEIDAVTAEEHELRTRETSREMDEMS